MATTIVTVNPGGGADYTSLSAALAANVGNLTGITCDVADEQGNNYIAMDIVCSGSTADTTAVAIASGWTTDATHRLRIRGATVAGPKWDGSLYRLVAAGAYNTGTLYINQALNLTLQDLQVEGTQTLDNAPHAVSTGDVPVDLNVVNGFYRLTSTSGTYFAARVFSFYGTTASNLHLIRMRNVTAVAYDGQAYFMNHYNTNPSSTLLLYNCTFVNRSANSRNILEHSWGSATSIRVKNLAIQGAGTCYTVGDGTDEKLTVLTQDATGTAGLTGKTLSFVDAANWDYHLASGDTDAIGAGTDLSADSYWPFSTDGDGDARSSWDVGADEIVSAPYTPDVLPFVNILLVP